METRRKYGVATLRGGSDGRGRSEKGRVSRWNPTRPRTTREHDTSQPNSQATFCRLRHQLGGINPPPQLPFPSAFLLLLLPPPQHPAAARYKYITFPLRLPPAHYAREKNSRTTPPSARASGRHCVRALYIFKLSGSRSGGSFPCVRTSCRRLFEFADVHLITPEDSGIIIHRGDREEKWGSNFESPGTICLRFRYRY